MPYEDGPPAVEVGMRTDTLPYPIEPTFTCPACGDTSALSGDAPVNPATEVIVCDECGTRIAFGIPVARVSVSAHPDDPRFRQLILKDHKGTSITVNLDRDLFQKIARKMASLP
jgi:hypothetical protein